MLKTANSIPRWLLLYTAFLTILSATTALLGYFAPQMIFVNLEIPFAAAQPVTFFYATRNVGIFVLFLFCLWQREAKVLCAALLLRLVVEVLDLLFTLRFGIGGFNPYLLVVSWSLIFLLPEYLGVRLLYQKAFGRHA